MTRRSVRWWPVRHLWVQRAGFVEGREADVAGCGRTVGVDVVRRCIAAGRSADYVKGVNSGIREEPPVECIPAFVANSAVQKTLAPTSPIHACNPSRGCISEKREDGMHRTEKRALERDATADATRRLGRALGRRQRRDLSVVDTQHRRRPRTTANTGQHGRLQYAKSCSIWPQRRKETRHSNIFI